MSGPPPLQPTGLWLRQDGRFLHEGQLVTHRRLHRVFLRGVRFLEEEGVFVVQLGRFRGQIDVEDTAFWVVAYEAERREIMLTDGSCERLQPETLGVDPDDVLRVQVKGRFPARFTQTGQAHLLDSVEWVDGALKLRVDAGDWVALPQLERVLASEEGSGS